MRRLGGLPARPPRQRMRRVRPLLLPEQDGRAQVPRLQPRGRRLFYGPLSG